MPIPSVLSTRVNAALGAVTETTDLDLLINYLEIGQRSNANIAAVVSELNRRANLVNSATPYDVAAKLAAAMFKIDNPSTALWAANAGGNSDSTVLGQYVQGWLRNNPNYVLANNSLYLASAYPDMTPLLNSGAIDRYYAPTQFIETIARGPSTDLADRSLRMFVDGNIIIVPQTPRTDGDYYLFNVSLDNGVTWTRSIYRANVNTNSVPELAFSSLNIGPLYAFDVVKLDSPGHYAAIVVNSTSNDRMFLITTNDSGLNWFGWAPILGGNSFDPSATRLFYRDGIILCTSPQRAIYSADLGRTWVNLTNQSQFMHSNLLANGNLPDNNGLWAYPTGTTLRAGYWPAFNSWNGNTSFFGDITNAFATDCNAIKKCGNSIWVAWHTSAGSSIYTQTNIFATFNRTVLTNVTVIYDVIEFGGNLYILGFGTNGIQVFTTPLSTTIPATLTPLSSADFPFTISATASLRWPIPSLRFAMMLGANVGAFFKHGRSGIVKYVGITGATRFQHVFHDQPINYATGFCRKYNRWFTSISPTYVDMSQMSSHYAILAQAVPGHLMLHYSSSDGRNWTPIGVGFGHIVDAGNRLVRLTANRIIEISTDGINWTTSGVTQLSGGPTNPVWGRLWRVKDRLFICLSSNALSGADSLIWVSSNGGLGWSPTGTGLSVRLPIAYIPAGISFFRNAYYALVVTDSNNIQSISPSTLNGVQVLRSTDAINWTTVVSQSNLGQSGNLKYDQLGIFNLNGLLCIQALGRPNTAQNVYPLYSTDGITFSNNVSTNVTAIFSSSTSLGMDTQNGEMRWYYDTPFNLSGNLLSRLTTFKEGVPDINILSNSSANITRGLSGDGLNLMGTNSQGLLIYTSDSLAFCAQMPNGGMTTPSSFMRVTK